MEWRKYRLEMVAEPNVTDTYECQLTTREKVASFLRSVIRLDKSDRERGVVMAIASDGSLIGYQEVSVGDLSSAVIHPREILKFAVLSNAAAIIIAHNHPSGSLKISAEDKEATIRLTECCDLIGIKLVDHLIVSDRGYTSVMDKEGEETCWDMQNLER